MIHSGFFFDNNSHDRVKIKLGVSKSDRLYAMKAEVLARAGIPTYVQRLPALPCAPRSISTCTVFRWCVSRTSLEWSVPMSASLLHSRFRPGRVETYGRFQINVSVVEGAHGPFQGTRPELLIKLNKYCGSLVSFTLKRLMTRINLFHLILCHH